ncbi:Putative DNA-binding domain protein [Neomoorella glycerini]|uniref:DNA-binding domain protein n=1 Tax=Neomoorella glycerini TaxID=55779 RepID=A0A6I5ZVN9_9FIRM|nr:ATP-binding protein [Moorella glycerini]QGP93775.1 Putative DNA-binding domain protein [Moorella glycerini]
MNERLFVKLLYYPEQEITIEDVKQFCLGSSENDRVEYKRWHDKFDVEKLVQRIVAMANTDGGLIFIGVVEEKDTGGRRDYAGGIEGIPLKEANSLKQSIEARCFNLTTPKWIPEILHISGLESEKSVLLIRIDPDKIERPLLFNEKNKLIGPFYSQRNRVSPTFLGRNVKNS